MKIKIICLLLCVVLCCSACKKTAPDLFQTEGGSETNTPAETVDFSKTEDEMFTDRDKNTGYTENGAAYITLNGQSAACASDAVKIEGSTVTITDEGTYVLQGTLTNGSITVSAGDQDKVQLVLDGANITNKTGAALFILEADKVFVTLAEGSENLFCNDGDFSAPQAENVDGAVFSKQDLTFNGAGALSVTCLTAHGIVCKDDLVFTSGNYTVQSASHGIDAKDSFRLDEAVIAIDAGKDGIHTENEEDTEKGFVYLSGGSIAVEAEGDGISASSFIQLENTTLNLLTGGGYENGQQQTSGGWGGFMGGGMGRPGDSGNTQTTDDGTSIKGLKAASSILINGGSITVDSADDAIHSNGSVVINGGSLALSTGDDGVHADETLTVTGGQITVTTCYEGLEALNIKISGGDIYLKATDDGINAAGGMDQSGTGGARPGGDMFGGMGGRPGGGMGGMSSGNGSILISGGSIYINSSGDGIDANGTLEISGGKTVVVGPTQGDTATLDYDVSGIITGGTFIGTGASGMAQSFSDSQNQGVIAIRVGNSAANTPITLTDEDGNEILSYTPELAFAVVILSSPDIVKGETYTITVGTQSGSFEAQ